MKKIIVITFVSLLGVRNALAQEAKDSVDRRAQRQDSIFHFQSAIDHPIVNFTANNLGELYIINTGNQLKKLNEKGDSVGVFNQVTQYGKLSYVDALNPWKTILFYENFSTIVLLDKYLNVLTHINLRKQNIFGVKAVGSSYDNNIWVYDGQENKLKKINEEGKTLQETVDFRLLFDSVPSPEKLVDRDGFVYLYDPAKGIYVFDHYGSFKNRLLFLHWKDIAVIEKYIYGVDEDHLYRFGLGSLDLRQYPLPADFRKSTVIKIGAGKIYFLRNNRLEIYGLR